MCCNPSAIAARHKKGGYSNFRSLFHGVHILGIIQRVEPALSFHIYNSFHAQNLRGKVTISKTIVQDELISDRLRSILVDDAVD